MVAALAAAALRFPSGFLLLLLLFLPRARLKQTVLHTRMSLCVFVFVCHEKLFIVMCC